MPRSPGIRCRSWRSRGRPARRFCAEVSTAAGQWLQRGFYVRVNDGQLTLAFSDLGGDPAWVVNGLTLARISEVDATRPVVLGEVTWTVTPGGSGPDRCTAEECRRRRDTVDTVSGTVVSLPWPTGAEPPVRLVTVSTTWGTITSDDASPEYRGDPGGMRWIPAAGSFSFQLRRPVLAGPRRDDHGRPVDGSAAVVSTVVSYTPVSMFTRRFDFNTSTSPTQRRRSAGGRDGLRGRAADGRLNAGRGYGWDTALTSSGYEYQGAVDRGDLAGDTPQELLRRDAHWSQFAHTFSVAVPAGRTYTVNVTFGDASFGAIRCRSRRKDRGCSATVDDAARPVAARRRSRSRSSSSGQLDLEFSDQGGDPYWFVNGVEIWQQPATLTLTRHRRATTMRTGSTEDTFTVTGGASGTLVTVSSTLGTILTDASPEYAGYQVAERAAPSNCGTRRCRARPTLTATAVDGSAGLASAVTQPYTAPAARRYDFNGTSNDTASGFIGVRGSQTYSAAVGYGWSATVSEFEWSRSSVTTKSTTSLYRDAHYGYYGTANARTFQVAAASSTTYEVRVYLGDAAYARDNMVVTVEGAASSSGLIATAKGAYTSVVLSGSDTNADGKLNITISDTGGRDRYWAVNGLDVWTGTDPGASPLIAASVAWDSSPGQHLSSPSTPPSSTPTSVLGSRSVAAGSLTPAQLQPVVASAIAHWSATGLSAAQVAMLSSTPIEVADLSPRPYLGLTTPERILIDDDGAGYGWKYEVGSTKDEVRRYEARCVRSFVLRPSSFVL